MANGSRRAGCLRKSRRWLAYCPDCIRNCTLLACLRIQEVDNKQILEYVGEGVFDHEVPASALHAGRSRLGQVESLTASGSGDAEAAEALDNAFGKPHTLCWCCFQLQSDTESGLAGSALSDLSDKATDAVGRSLMGVVTAEGADSGCCSQVVDENELHKSS